MKSIEGERTIESHDQAAKEENSHGEHCSKKRGDGLYHLFLGLLYSAILVTFVNL